jgi:hypothetical protein
MAQRTVFCSWESDLPRQTNHSLIETYRNQSIQKLRASGTKLDPCLDRYTADVSGSPDISATILDEINHCHAVVCDTSIVQVTRRPTNPSLSRCRADTGHYTRTHVRRDSPDRGRPSRGW